MEQEGRAAEGPLGPTAEGGIRACRLRLAGHVQGVGYRPFAYRLARELGIGGWVKNCTGAVEIQAEGRADRLDAFVDALINRAPAIARPRLVARESASVSGTAEFAILASDAGSQPDIHVPPDYFTCAECLAEMRDPGNRRHGYAFINCTQCGPRYTLITALPYDRPNTSMAGFPLCPDCRAEYEDPGDRRFHAEPVACPVCGPHLRFFAGGRDLAADDHAALDHAIAALRSGKTLAVKGVGGYHLLCDASNAQAVAELRRRKHRPVKPLAVLFPSLDALRATLATTPADEALLASPARPILLLPPRAAAALATGIAPGLGEIGGFLPYSPLHALLLERFGRPLVATSGNISGEPVLTDNGEARHRLASIADAFLDHDRPIVRPADDSVFRPIAGQPRPLRLGRGTAPLELDLPRRLPQAVLALGAHTKNTLTLAWEGRAVVSPHIGDLDSARSLEILAQVAEDLQRLYRVRARRLLIDRHPGYGYRAHVRKLGLPPTEIWHHHAHASALAWEFPAVTHWIVFAWDGVGLGEDGSLWGGEAFTGCPGQWQRRASFRSLRLPGGERAGREPWRSAAAMLWETGQAADFAPDLVFQAWRRGLNSPTSTAVGRLFDAAAALTGICGRASFEGEGPMHLEALAAGSLSTPSAKDAPPLPLARDGNGLWRSDWSPLLPLLMDGGLPAPERAAHFHATLARTLVDQARRLREETASNDVGLTGGVFQNRLLTEIAVPRLEAEGFRVHLPERVPVNDAGVSFGQVIEFLQSRT